MKHFLCLFVLLSFTASSIAADVIAADSKGRCPIGYSERKGYCSVHSFMPEGDRNVIQKVGGNCPAGYTFAGKGFCRQNSIDATVSSGSIEKVGHKCPPGYYEMKGYCRSAK